MTMRIHSIQPAPVQFAGKWSDRVKKGLAIGAITALPLAGVGGAFATQAEDTVKTVTVPNLQNQQKKQAILMEKTIKLIALFQQTQKLSNQETVLWSEVGDLLNQLKLDQRGEVQLSKQEACKIANELLDTTYQLARGNKKIQKDIKKLQKELKRFEKGTSIFTKGGCIKGVIIPSIMIGIAGAIASIIIPLIRIYRTYY